jgi:hypothetical protein
MAVRLLEKCDAVLRVGALIRSFLFLTTFNIRLVYTLLPEEVS